MNWIKLQDLHAYLKNHFQLDWFGYHGIPHWSRVYVNARKLARAERARDPAVYISDDVIQLFSFLHDNERWDEYDDPDHGARAAAAAHQLRGHFFEITDDEMKMLCFAMTHHSDGIITAEDKTVAVCWDADRLDLGRVGTRPHPAYLCTETARTDMEFLQEAWVRSIRQPARG